MSTEESGGQRPALQTPGGGLANWGNRAELSQAGLRQAGLALVAVSQPFVFDQTQKPNYDAG